MKKLLTITLLFISLIITAQKRNTVIEIDLGIPDNETIKVLNEDKENDVNVNQLELFYKNSLSFNFINGNPLRYTYKIKNNLVSLFEDSDLNIFDKSQILPDVESDTKAKIIEPESTALSEKKDFAQALIYQEYNERISLTKIEYDKGQSDNIIFFTDKKAKIDSVIFNESYIKPAIKQKNTKIVSSELDSNIDNSKTLHNEILLFIQNSKVKKSLNKDYFETERNKFYTDYLVLQSKYNVLDEIINNKELINAENLKKLKNNEDINSKIEENLKILFKVNFDNYSLPIDVTGKNIDLVEVTLEIYDKEKNELIESHPYRVWIRDGIKIDVSGGLYFSSLVNDEFFTEDDPNNADNKIIRQKDIGKFDFGFGSLLNVRFRSGKDYTFMANVGAMLKADQDFQFLTGLGVSLGRDERIIFNAGLAMGKVNRLQSNYSVGSSYNLGDSSTVSVVKKFDVGYFFGVSYNFSKPKKNTEQ